MDLDDLQPKRQNDPIALLAREDLDRLSVAELQQRVTALEVEIARVTTKLAGASAFKSAAAALFKAGG